MNCYKLDGYKFYVNYRVVKNGGGVMILEAEALPSKQCINDDLTSDIACNVRAVAVSQSIQLTLIYTYIGPLRTDVK